MIKQVNLLTVEHVAAEYSKIFLSHWLASSNGYIDTDEMQTVANRIAQFSVMIARALKNEHEQCALDYQTL